MEFYKSRNSDRKRSKRDLKRFDKPARSFRNSRNNNFPNDQSKESTSVTCADCGRECKIPFVPKHDRPVYCSECFKHNKPRDSDDQRRDNNSRYSRKNQHDESTSVTCADCGRECKIPFVPKHDRPVYCSECFKHNKPRYSDDQRRDNSRSRDGRRNESRSPRLEKSRTEKFLKKRESFYADGSEKFYASLKEKLFEILGGKICTSCGFKDERALGVCHIYDRELFDNIRRGGFASSWGKYISDPNLARKELRVLCLNCNEIRQPISEPKETKPKSNRKKNRFFPR